jgi:hypothetical protein
VELPVACLPLYNSLSLLDVLRSYRQFPFLLSLFFHAWIVVFDFRSVMMDATNIRIAVTILGGDGCSFANKCSRFSIISLMEENQTKWMFVNVFESFWTKMNHTRGNRYFDSDTMQKSFDASGIIMRWNALCW